MEEDIKGAIERLSKVQNDIWYATLYSQEEQNEDIKLLIKGYRELENKLNQLNAYIFINGIDEGLKTATQIRIENQHEYLHLKQVEKLKERIEQLKENSIQKSKVKEKIEELKKEYKIALEENSIKAFILKCQIEILEKLLEEVK